MTKIKEFFEHFFGHSHTEDAGFFDEVILHGLFETLKIIPFLLIEKPLLLILYALLFFVYMRLAVNFAVRKTVMASIWKELDAEKYAAIINAKPFFPHYSYKLNLYFVTGDYQSAYNMISSVLIQHKNV